MAILLDGKKTARKIQQKLKEKCLDLDYQPHLAVIQVGKDHEGSNLYIKYKQRTANEVGMKCTTYELPINVTQSELITIIKTLNTDTDIDGVLLQMPLPSHLDQWQIIPKIIHLKDVDGLCPVNNYFLDNKQPGLRPATPRGILTLLKAYNIPIKGTHVVIVNRSHLVGNPLHKLLRMHHSTVTQCHSKTKDLPLVAHQADILVVACGNPELVTTDWVKDSSVVIDVSSPKGDCFKHYEAIKEKVHAITPVPGGVGPMTIASLLENTYEASLNHRNKN